MPSQVRDSTADGYEQRETNEFSLGVSLLAAQILAGLGTNGVSLGKRDLSEAELRGFFDTLGNGILNGLQSVWSNVIQNPLEQALQSTFMSVDLRLVPHPPSPFAQAPPSWPLKSSLVSVSTV